VKPIRKRSDAFTEADVGDEIILMRLDNGELLSLTETGAAVWRMIDGSRDRAALIAALRKQYVGSAEDIGRDVDQLMDLLNEAGLIAEG
jgi:hypothetical protein